MKTTFMSALLLIVICNVTSTFAQTTPLSEQSLSGHWTCESILPGSIYKDSQESLQPGWQLQEDGLIAVLKTELNFSSSNAGGYMLQSSSPNPMNVSSSQAIQSPYRIRSEYLILDYKGSQVNSLYAVKKMDDHMTLNPTAGGFLPVLTCDKVLPLSTLSTTAP